MKRIFKRAGHLWRAKGRHGTHSPFVYAFVEQVMRSRKRFAINTSSDLLTQKQIDLTGRAIRYLRATTVYADSALFDIVNAIGKDASCKVLPLDTTRQDYGAGTCFVCLPTVEAVRFLQQLASLQICAAIIPLDHKDLTGLRYWELLREAPAFAMVLDAWHIGFISNHPDFKVKQYFAVR